MDNTTKIRLSGSGGQGLVLTAIILAEAVNMEGLNVVQTQSYGPEARGGSSKAELIISKDDIDYPKVIHPDIFLSLTQESHDKYINETAQDGINIIDSEIESGIDNKKIYQLPIISTAREEIKKEITANMVALGILNSIAKIVPSETLEKAISKNVPHKTIDINIKAYKKGWALGGYLHN